MDTGETQANEPDSDDEEKEKETEDDAGEANAEDNFEGIEKIFLCKFVKKSSDGLVGEHLLFNLEAMVRTGYVPPNEYMYIATYSLCLFILSE